MQYTLNSSTDILHLLELMLKYSVFHSLVMPKCLDNSFYLSPSAFALCHFTHSEILIQRERHSSSEIISSQPKTEQRHSYRSCCIYSLCVTMSSMGHCNIISTIQKELKERITKDYIPFFQINPRCDNTQQAEVFLSSTGSKRQSFFLFPVQHMC